MNKSRTVSFLAGLALGVSMMTPVQAIPYTSEMHVFSIDDVQGDFEGRTYGGTVTSDGSIPPDTSIICGIGGGAQCPDGIGPITDTKLLPNQNLTLYPVDSTFGYEVIDFLGAAQKSRDFDYLEGFVGNITSGFPTSAMIDGEMVQFDPPIEGGIAVSNAATETYKVKPPMGTWCRGLGGNSVKCETEHYSVMEHILSCHELIPYFFADPVTGMQTVLNDDGAIEDLGSFDCADAGLDDIALIMSGGDLGDQLIDGTPCDDVNDPVGCQMFPNDKTDTQNNVALTTDYSVQLKDDGKALYGWGTIHKRPNDIRLSASIPLPEVWKEPGARYIVNSAKLVVRHHITNNPNDQLRPEDLENEAATGRKPSYTIEGEIGGPNEVWKSTKACFEGDGDLIDNEDGNIDPTFIDVGTFFKNTQFAITTSPPTSTVPTNDDDLPYPLSSDLTGAFTNAWYTTIDRDPFEWSYDMDPDPTVQDFEGSWLEDPSLVANGGTLISGPRWRLKPNKYGQDLPGLEITKDVGSEEGLPQPPEGADCYPPPFEKALIKYEVGLPIITEINLLDWNEEANGPSPLADSRGWVDVTQNGFVTVAGYNTDGEGSVPYTTNGLPMSDDLDLAVYIKGDRKATAVYDAWIVMDYEEAVPVEVPSVLGLTELAASELLAPDLLLEVIGTVCSNDYAVDTIAIQDPVAGEELYAGDTVDVTLSEGDCPPEPVLVPPVGECPTVAEATAIIVGEGLTVNPVNIEEQSDVCAAGLVLRTEPAAGTEVEAGSQVTLIVASDEPPVILSDVTIRRFSPPTFAVSGTNSSVIVILQNASGAEPSGPGTVTVTGSDDSVLTAEFDNIDPGARLRIPLTWTAPDTSGTVTFEATVTISGVVVDTATGSTLVL